MVRAGKYCPLEYRSQVEDDMVWGMGSGLVCLHIKGVLTGTPFIIDGNLLTLGSAVFLINEPLISRYPEIQKIKTWLIQT